MRLCHAIPDELTAVDGKVITIFQHAVYELFVEYADVSLLTELRAVNRICETLGYVLLEPDAHPKLNSDSQRIYSFRIWVRRGWCEKYTAAMPENWYHDVDAANKKNKPTNCPH